MAAQDGQPESSTAPRRGSRTSASPAPSFGSRGSSRGRGRGRGKGKAVEPHRQPSESQTETDTLRSMIQFLTDEVAALRNERVSNERVSSERVSPERQPSAGPPGAGTPHSTTVLPSMEPLLDPPRFPSMARSGVTDITHGPRTYKTRDVQTLSNGTDPTYEAWSIQLEGKFLEP